jgi:hypothetical protein
LYLFVRREIVVIAVILPTMYEIRVLSNILLSNITPYAEDIVGDHECGF